MVIAIDHPLSIVHRHSLVEGRSCLLASSAIHCRFVDRFAGFMVPSRVSRQWLSPHDASLSSFGSQRAWFPALSGTMKALRLPTCVSVVAYWFASTAHPILQLRVRRSAPRRSEVPSRPGLWVAGRPSFRLSIVWTQLGPLRSSGDPSRAFAPFPDPGRTDVPSPFSVTSMLPPLPTQRRLRRLLISGLTPAALAPAAIRFALRVATRAQGSLPAGWLAFAGRASNPLDRYERFQFV
jgi:hypothetical protein